MVTLKDGVPVNDTISIDSVVSDDTTVVHSNKREVKIYTPHPDIAVTVSKP